MSHAFFVQHEETLRNAITAIRERTYYSAYPEVPSGRIYGESARADGEAAFTAQRDHAFAIDQPTTGAMIGGEVSPFGPALGVTYPAPDVDGMIAAASDAQTAWAEASIDTRVGVCLEILHRLNQRSFEMGFAVMHTTGQGFMMAFQAGGPHAQDRGLEALAYAYEEMTRTPATATWVKRVGKEETVTLEKRFRIVPRGIALAIGCSTFPTWNTYPGLFASLATGNPVIVKPHPSAILPLAITVGIARDVLKEAGFDPNVVQLAVDSADAPITGELATHSAVRIVDYTGGSAYGSWVEANATQAVVYTEKAGVNTVVIDSIDDVRAVTGNLAFTLSLYSGQMCTTSQNIYIPKDGITVAGAPMSFDDIAGALVKAVDWLLGDPARAAEILGAVQNPATVERVADARRAAEAAGATILRESSAIENAAFPDARTASPLIVKTDTAQRDLFEQEMFGPIVYVVATANTAESIELATACAEAHGGITAALYSTDDDVVARAEEAFAAVGVPLSSNLVGSIWVNQSAAFSDFHVSGANPAGNATLCNGAFVAGRFNVVQSRVLTPSREAVAS